MKKILFSFLLVCILAFIPYIVFAETNALPEAVNGVITLEEDITLSGNLTITNNVKIDLNNHVLKFTKADNHFNDDVTIENGTIDVSGVTNAGDGILRVGNYGGTSGSLTLNNVKFKGDTYNSAYAVIYVYGENKLNINDSTMDLSNEESSSGGVIKAEKGTSAEINIINSTLNFTDTVRGILDGTVLIKDSNVTIKGTKSGGLDNGINTSSGGLALTLDNTKLNVSNADGRGITLDGTTVNIKNGSSIAMSNCAEGEIYAKTSGVINIDDKSYIDAVISQRSGATGTISVSGGIFTSKVNDAYLAEGYICKKVNDNYVVGKENEITVPSSIEGGSVNVKATKAVVGETIELTVTANKGYGIQTVELIGLETGSKQAIKNNQFTMPNEPVKVNVVFKKLTQEVVAPTIDKTEEVKDVTIGVSNSTQVDKVLLETLMSNKELAELTKDNNIKVEIEIKEIEVSKNDQEKINEELGKKAENIAVLKYFDITVYVKNKDTNAKLGTLSELNEKIKFTVALPTELQKPEEGYIRNYYVVRVHNGKVEILDTELSKDGKFLDFESGEFSTYAIAYNDVKQADDNENIEAEDETIDNEATENEGTGPKTGDNITTYAVVAIISVMGIVVLNKSKKYMNKNSK